MSAQATTSVNSASALSSASTVTVDATRTRTADAAVTSSASLAATVFRTQDNQAALTATATLTIVAGQEQEAEAAFSSAIALSATAVKTANGSASELSEFTQVTEAARTRSTAVSVTANANLSATAVKINPGSAALASTATVTIEAVKTTAGVVSASSQFQQSTVANRTANALTEFNSIATQLTVAFQNASGTVLLESTASLSAIIGAIKQGVPERAITGIRFNDDAATELGDSFIKIAHYNPPPGGPSLSDRYAVSFWAYSPEGTVLTHHPTGNNSNGYMKFTEGSFELRSPHPSNDYRTATWTGLTTTGWHHYIVYQEPISGAVNPVIKLYQDGVLKSDPTIFTFSDGVEPPVPPSDDLLAVYFEQQFNYLHWAIGAEVNLWRDSINEITNAARTIQPMQGILSQFVSYWTTVPDFTDSAIRQKLYNAGYVDLGNSGTLSGLAQPNIYLRLQNYRDVGQLGSLDLYANAGSNGIPPAPRIEWREISQFGYNPTWDNQDWILTSLHEGEVQDNFGNGFLVIADLECSVSGVFLFELPISAEFTTTILGQRVRTADAALVCTSTLSAQAQAELSFASTLNAQATLGSVNVDRFRATAAALTASSAITVEQGFLQVAAATLTSTATLTCEPTEIEAIQGAAALTTTASLAADVNNIIFMQATASAAFAVTSEATLIPPVRADAILTAAFSLVINAGGVYGNISLVASAGTLAADVSVIRGASAQLTATATQTTQPNKRTGIAPTTLQVAGFVLTAGDIINFEPSLTYYVPQETRTLFVLPESREYIIEQETRQLILLEG